MRARAEEYRRVGEHHVAGARRRTADLIVMRVRSHGDSVAREGAGGQRCRPRGVHADVVALDDVGSAHFEVERRAAGRISSDDHVMVGGIGSAHLVVRPDDADHAKIGPQVLRPRHVRADPVADHLVVVVADVDEDRQAVRSVDQESPDRGARRQHVDQVVRGRNATPVDLDRVDGVVADEQRVRIRPGLREPVDDDRIRDRHRESGWIVWTPEPEMLKAIMSRPAFPLASRIAWRSDPAPLSLVLVTVNVAAYSDPASATNPTARLILVLTSSSFPPRRAPRETGDLGARRSPGGERRIRLRRWMFSNLRGDRPTAETKHRESGRKSRKRADRAVRTGPHVFPVGVVEEREIASLGRRHRRQDRQQSEEKSYRRGADEAKSVGTLWHPETQDPEHPAVMPSL